MNDILNMQAGKWKRETPIKGGHGGCLCCGYQHEILPDDAVIAVGFGMAYVTKNGETVYDEWDVDAKDWSDYWTCADAEKQAALDPDNDWRIHLIAPLSKRHYQRQDKHWVLYERGEGFA